MLLVAAAAAASLAARAVSPLQETMRASLHLSDNQMSLLQGPALAIPVVLAAIPIGLLIDRFSRVRLLFVFALLDMVGSLTTAFATSFAMLFLARCLIGLTSTTIIITGFSLLADYYPPAQRGRAKAVLVMGQYGGTSATFALGGALLAQFTAVDGWRWAMFWLTTPILALAALLVLAMREPARTGTLTRDRSSKQTFAALWQIRPLVLPLMLGIVFVEVPLFAINAWAAPALSRGFALSSTRVGAILATATLVSGILGPILGGSLADLCHRAGGPRRTMLASAGLALLGAPAGLFAVIPSVSPASGLLVACITIVGATVAMSATLFTIVIPNELRGLCLSIMAAANSIIGMACAPLMVSGIAAVLGGPAMIGTSLTLVCTTASVLCALTFLVGRRFIPKELLP